MARRGAHRSDKSDKGSVVAERGSLGFLQFCAWCERENGEGKGVARVRLGLLIAEEGGGWSRWEA